MKANEIFSKTIKFVWFKIGLGILHTIVAILALLILTGLVTIAESLAIVWVIIIGFLYGAFAIIYQAIEFLLKAGHVAVVSSATVNGKVPEDMVNYAKQKVDVMQNFKSITAFYFLFMLVRGAARQIANVVMSVTSTVTTVIPGGSAISSLMRSFIKIFLGTIPEIILAYTFYKDNQRREKAALDGLRIFFKNFKLMTKSAFITSLLIVVFWAVFLIVFIGALFTALINFNFLAVLPILIIFFIAKVLKNAFIDSWIMVKMVHTYMSVAPNTQLQELDFEMYRKCSKYRRLEERAIEQKSEVA